MIVQAGWGLSTRIGRGGSDIDALAVIDDGPVTMAPLIRYALAVLGDDPRPPLPPDHAAQTAAFIRHVADAGRLAGKPARES